MNGLILLHNQLKSCPSEPITSSKMCFLTDPRGRGFKSRLGQKFFFFFFSFSSILYEAIKISYKRWFFNIWHIFLLFKEKIMARAVVKRKTFISINIFDRFHFFWSFHLQHTPLKTNRHILGSSTFFGSFPQYFYSVSSFWYDLRK